MNDEWELTIQTQEPASEIKIASWRVNRKKTKPIREDLLKAEVRAVSKCSLDGCGLTIDGLRFFYFFFLVQ